MVANKELFKMDIDIQRRAVAVLLSYQGEADSEGYINQTLVDKWIEKISDTFRITWIVK